ncbi:MAG TPA: type III-B CRISPR module RAMP protein Cmr4 [Alphaproteobacteria bacterium]|nr:type III-B CRISPR module RAMP protein Cmr4 [Alphaproteobacteria bacterium]
MIWQRLRYWLMTLDPVHIGTGGYRLGRVDNAIVREPGTNLPKIPGTSLSGAVRSAAAMRWKSVHPDKPLCAGQGGHCGNFQTCPICYTFGSARDGRDSRAGAVSLGDVRLVLFPVSSWDGPVWLSTAETLRELDVQNVPTSPQPEEVALTSGLRALNKVFGLGWLMLGITQTGLTLTAPTAWQTSAEFTHALTRTVLVHESIFSHLVNAGLEVRTSVAIDPNTGAAQERALFTYEAIPRAAFLSFDATIDDYRQDFPATGGLNWQLVTDVLEDGLGLTEYLGIGGMSTRGFGRI